jgi:hypothetical protein
MMFSVLDVLAPLIDNKVIEFRKPNFHLCPSCFRNIDKPLTNFLKSTVNYDAEINVTTLSSTNRSHDILIDSPEFTRLLGVDSLEVEIKKGTKAYSTFTKRKKRFSSKIKDQPFLMKGIINSFKGHLENVLSGIHSANKTSSLFIAKSEMDTLFLSSLDGVNIQRNEIREWEAIRSINLPWVGELNINQILNLREQASASLESLRQQITLAFMQGGQKDVLERVAELAVNTSELKQQILENNIIKQSMKKSNRGLSSLAIALIIYGLASANPIAGVGSVAALLATLYHINDCDKAINEKEAKIVTNPSYALLRAGELLRCRE